MSTFPTEIGAAEIRDFLKFLEKESSLREKQLLEAARKLSAEEEALDALYVKFEDLDTDFHRTAYSAQTTSSAVNFLRDRNAEIAQDISAVESELPSLSLVNTRPKTGEKKLTDPEDIFRNLEAACQHYAFLVEKMRRTQQKADPQLAIFKNVDAGGAGSSPTAHGKLKRQPVDPLFLKISESKVLLENLEWALKEIADRVDGLRAVGGEALD